MVEKIDLTIPSGEDLLKELDSLIDAGYIRKKKHPIFPLWIYNYTQKTQYEGKWNNLTRACRGLILDENVNIIARPFPKFFNLGEKGGELREGESYVATEKMDGSLGIGYWWKGKWYIATRGSFDSEQAFAANYMLELCDIVCDSNFTPLYEIIYPDNKIVVDYGQEKKLVLLDIINNETGHSDIFNRVGDFSSGFNCNTGMAYQTQIFVNLDIKKAQEESRPNHEGYVLHYESGHRVKIKHKEYVRLHKVISGFNETRVWECLSNYDSLEELIEGVPDEFYKSAKKMHQDLIARYENIEDQCQQAFFYKPDTEDRKELAQYFKSTSANLGVLFAMLDGKEYDQIIWKAINPVKT